MYYCQHMEDLIRYYMVKWQCNSCRYNIMTLKYCLQQVECRLHLRPVLQKFLTDAGKIAKITADLLRKPRPMIIGSTPINILGIKKMLKLKDLRRKASKITRVLRRRMNSLKMISRRFRSFVWKKLKKRLLTFKRTPKIPEEFLAFYSHFLYLCLELLLTTLKSTR